MDSLYDYQKEHLDILISIIKEKRVALDVSNTGTGKTFVAIVLAKHMKLPYIILCPKCMISSWKRVGTILKYPAQDVVNYDTARMGKMYGASGRVRSSYLHKNGTKFTWNLRKETLIVFDEADVCTHNGTVNNSLLLSFKPYLKDNYLLLLSATLCSSKKNIPSVMTIIGLLESHRAYPNFIKFKIRSLPAEDEQDATRKILFPTYGHGMFISKLGDRFTSNSIHLEMYDIDDIEEAQKEYKEIEANLNILRELRSKEHQLYFFLTDKVRKTVKKIEKYNGWKKIAMNVIKKTKCEGEVSANFLTLVNKITQFYQNYLDNGMGNRDESLAEANELLAILKAKRNRYYHVKENEIIVRINRARQRIELKRIPIFIELTQSALEEGKSVVIFVNFVRTLEILKDKLQTECVMYGKNSMNKSIENVANFQEDKERIIICQSQSGSRGISLHDVTGKHPRLSLISPIEGDNLIQVLGRVNRAGSKSIAVQKIIYLAKTIEENVCTHMYKNMSNMDRTLGSLGHLKILGLEQYARDPDDILTPLVHDDD
jgi:superfamily II DNA or RNA helicase